MPNPWGGDRVPFDFDGSLELARQMWALAATVRSADSARSSHADVARTGWKGTYAHDFDRRVEDERSTASHVADALQGEANGWAKAWQKAMQEQNRRNRASAVAEERASRGWWERNVGDRFGHDDSEQQVKSLPHVGLPTGPGFVAPQGEGIFP